MPAIVITGASRGLGYAFATLFASQPDTKVIGIVRDVASTEQKLQKDGIQNITLLAADVTDYAALSRAAEATAKLTGGGIDLLINNAAVGYEPSRWKYAPDIPPAEFERDLLLNVQVNVLGVAHSINAFLPLIRAGNGKKIVSISSGMARDETAKLGIASCVPYSVSKAALNSLVAKYDAALRREGILCMAICPGVVDTSAGRSPPTEEDMKGMQEMGALWHVEAPHFTGPRPVDESARMVVDVINNATVENMGGAFVSHYGNSEQWL